MSDIYRNATRTIVWLGDNRPPLTKKAFAIIGELAAEAASRGYKSVGDGSSYPSLSSLSRVGTGPECMESAAYVRLKDDFSVLHLASSDWWFRTWTVQEFLLAPEPVIMTGTYTMDWARVCAGVDYGLPIGLWNPLILGLIVDPAVLPYLSMSALWKQRRSELPSAVTPPSQAAQLLGLLMRCRFRQASDPRNKVYALLGLKHGDEDSASARALEIEADYRLSVSEVYCHTARQLLLQSADLNLLAASTPVAATNQPPLTLPSWVPDWNDNTPIPHPLMHDALGLSRQTHASRGTHPTPRFSDNNQTLIFTGHSLTTITHLSPVLRRLPKLLNPNDLLTNHRATRFVTRLSAYSYVFAGSPACIGSYPL